MTKWSIELAKFGMEFASRVTIKGNILVDFIVECSFENPVDTIGNITYNLKYCVINVL